MDDCSFYLHAGCLQVLFRLNSASFINGVLQCNKVKLNTFHSVEASLDELQLNGQAKTKRQQSEGGNALLVSVTFSLITPNRTAIQKLLTTRLNRSTGNHSLPEQNLVQVRVQRAPRPWHNTAGPRSHSDYADRQGTVRWSLVSNCFYFRWWSLVSNWLYLLMVIRRVPTAFTFRWWLGVSTRFYFQLSWFQVKTEHLIQSHNTISVSVL